MDKQKAAKIILIISFVPYGLVLLSGIFGAIFGVGFFFDTVYGLDGFLIGILGAGMSMIYIPIIPACLIYQIVYLIRSKVEFLKKIPFKKFAPVAGGIALVIIGVILVNSFEYEISAAIQKNAAKRMLKNAEEKIEYDMAEYDLDGIFGFKDCIHDCILVDYDKNEVGLLYSAGYDEYWSVRLAPTDGKTVESMERKYILQAEIPLNSPGKRLLTFSENPSNSHRTIAMVMEMSDGSVLYADNICEPDTGYTRYSGLNSSIFRIKAEDEEQ
ncbi:MAG: hypothetical protein J5999_06445 [Oscillospiraceae bacterium]|nr:hypothetical protein [Oscillospiraceae bacterium]